MAAYFLQTRLARLVNAGVSMSAPPAPAGGDFISPIRKYPSDTGSAFREMWFDGFSEQGKIGEYAASTAARKKRKGLPYDRLTLHETGELYARTEIARGDDGYIVRVDVPYAKYLVKRYGERILWMGGEYLQKWQQQLANELKIKILREWLSEK